VTGVDRRREVVDALERGVAPIAEPSLDDRIEKAHAQGTLSCTTDLAEATRRSDVSLLCVGTPLGPDGQLDESDLLAACEVIADAARDDARHVLVLRSTIEPSTYRRIEALLRARSGERVALALNPEFLREGSAVADLEKPELVVYATEDDDAAKAVEALYAEHADRLHRADPETVAMLKLVNNAWHALKVAFANEIARVAGPHDVDPFQLMELLCKDARLNTSAKYLRPGLPFGGACLTKDVAALSFQARRVGADTPVVSAILSSNRAHLDHLVEAIMAHAPKQIAIIGVGFKPGAADVRDSAAVRLVGELLDRGVHVTVADSAVLDARIEPRGLDALRAALGDPRAHASPSIEKAVKSADLIVVGHPSPADRDALVALAPGVPILDCAGELSRHLSDEEREALAPVVLVRQ
jgi:GDP-mannose 6-dehydrogenase